MAEFKNPTQGGGSTDNRSFVVILVVMLGVMIGLQFWKSKHTQPTAPPDAPSAVSQTASTPAAPATANAATAPSATTPTVAASAESTTVVENELYRITFSNRGGEVRSWILKKYKDNYGSPLDLVHDGAARLHGYPMSLYTYDAGTTQALAQALYVPSTTGALTAPGTLTYKYAGGGLDVTKTFTFGTDYVIHADTQVLRNGVPVSGLLSWPAGFGDMETPMLYASASVDLDSKGSTDHIALKKISSGATLNQSIDWAGITDQYFGAIFLPDHADDATLVTLEHQIDVNKVQSRKGAAPPVLKPDAKPVEVPVIGAALGSKAGHVQTRLFVGPKDWQVLGSLNATSGESLRSVVDFGFWGPVGKAMFLGLRWVHTLIAPAQAKGKDFSWGWAIVLFTVLINLIMLPLRVKGMSGMLKMQRIQPEIDAIKAKYGNPGPTDPKSAEMNAEVMAYQKAQGVSMFGGCIPTLITFPLLFAMLTMINRVVELRQAHFFWLPDLSLADPYHILPIFMVVTSFLVQFYTPSPGVDPTQQRMMAFMMPLFSGYFTWNYASGLALYWNVGNLIMIAQQQVMNRTKLGKEMKELQLRNAARKAAGNTRIAGKPSGKTIQGKR